MTNHCVFLLTVCISRVQWLDELSPEFFEAEFNDVEYVLNRTESLELEELQAFRDRRFQVRRQWT